MKTPRRDAPATTNAGSLWTFVGCASHPCSLKIWKLWLSKVSPGRRDHQPGPRLHQGGPRSCSRSPKEGRRSTKPVFAGSNPAESTIVADAEDWRCEDVDLAEVSGTLTGHPIPDLDRRSRSGSLGTEEEVDDSPDCLSGESGCRSRRFRHYGEGSGRAARAARPDTRRPWEVRTIGSAPAS